MVNILDKIVARKREEVAQLPAGPVRHEQLKAAIASRGGCRDFIAALQQPRRGKIALIAEVKKASPSAGVIREDFDPVTIARQYEAAGASCLSVLTDEMFFQGSLQYLKDIRSSVALPLLRKDFIIDERQVLQAVEWGADAILLIVAILEDSQLKHLMSLASGSGLSVLVEVHDEEELERAIQCGARLIGVNNRNLKTFQVDLATTERLASRLAAHTSFLEGCPILVAESGIHTAQDVHRLADCGARAILVGESLMRHRDISAKVSDLLATPVS